MLEPHVPVGQTDATVQPISGEAVALADNPPRPVEPVGRATPIKPRDGLRSADESPAQIEQIGPARTIAQHIERLGQRYAQAPANEDLVADVLAVGKTTQQMPGTPAGDALTSASDASPVIIHDDELVSIKLAELVSLFEDRLDRPLYVWMKESKSAAKYVTVETLAAAGIAAKYDPQSRQVVFSVTDE